MSSSDEDQIKTTGGRRRIKKTFQQHSKRNDSQRRRAVSALRAKVGSGSDESDDDSDETLARNSLRRGNNRRTVAEDIYSLDESEVAFLRAAAKRVQADQDATASSTADKAEQTRQNDSVVLDVGGHRFKTTVTTLTKYSE